MMPWKISMNPSNMSPLFSKGDRLIKVYSAAVKQMRSYSAGVEQIKVYSDLSYSWAKMYQKIFLKSETDNQATSTLKLPNKSQNKMINPWCGQREFLSSKTNPENLAPLIPTTAITCFSLKLCRWKPMKMITSISMSNPTISSSSGKLFQCKNGNNGLKTNSGSYAWKKRKTLLLPTLLMKDRDIENFDDWLVNKR